MSIQAVGQTTAGAVGAAVTSSSGSTAASTSTVPTSSTSGSSSTGSTSGTTSSSYTVNISSAARALLAEASETSVQTAQEAANGDHQAQRLLAKETAAKAG
ncbi:hypothetical protein EVC45_30310 [Paraburkholderia sp. UYCP14C]|uniref:hypothetical protein n=1 Tax=Paraburkholderia sp. UYCP14C TaxID=2511130 RepID=UPI001022453F|nr:hypothetical protein [Paraburkholderia sp. UYCP14C]RZF25991.1 hypothetical protein EVC45_30310 [Paraburkholderia sp. UYCP14C]